MIVIFHGLCGKYNQKKQEFYESINDDLVVLQPIINYLNIKEFINKFKTLMSYVIEDNKPSSLMFVGNSLGGFIAEYFSHYFSGNLLLINPSLDINRISIHNNDFKDFQVKNRSVPGLVLLDESDLVLNSNDTYELLKNNYEIIKFKGEGHRFSRYDMYKDKIQEIYHNSV